MLCLWKEKATEVGVGTAITSSACITLGPLEYPLSSHPSKGMQSYSQTATQSLCKMWMNRYKEKLSKIHQNSLLGTTVIGKALEFSAQQMDACFSCAEPQARLLASKNDGASFLLVVGHLLLGSYSCYVCHIDPEKQSHEQTLRYS